MITLSLTLGAVEIGIALAIYLFGALTFQILFFFRTFHDEKALIKGAVVLIGIAVLGHTISFLHLQYIVTVTGFGNVAYIARPPNSLASAIFFGAAVSAIVQAMFIRRLQRLANIHRLISIVIWLCVALRAAVSIVLTVLVVQCITISSLLAEFSWLVTTVMASGMAIDVSVALALAIYFSIQRNNTPLPRTAALLERIMAFSLTTGLLPSVLSVSVVICFETLPTTVVWMVPYILLPHMYAHAILASLNIRPTMTQHHSNVIELPTIASSSLPSNQGQSLGLIETQRIRDTPFSKSNSGNIFQNSNERFSTD
ncbi:hypothetical protein BT96DRAFT_1021383 [Gymnopus androsaceus JB14]|uniref:DUF6534 domain-containing protein n=1 Tax=Gymnopus androsaceus JB14 TaxID=1447944 RepID=A0A6A4HGQ8_9AGAR|nr:hypothetical protein BT96DRAFT_1021383 [Gymnopus androsaceus JB14]